MRIETEDAEAERALAALEAGGNGAATRRRAEPELEGWGGPAGEAPGLDELELDRLAALALGLRGRAAVELRRLFAKRDLAGLSRLEPEELRAAGALGARASLRLAAAFALGRRVERAQWVRSESMRTPAGVHRLMAPRMRGLERETLYVLLLDGKHRLKAVRRVSEGTLTSSLVHPREVFAPALRTAAAAIIAVHNHPSGDPEPSAEDLAVTRRLAEAGRLLGVPLLDHLVVAAGGFVSLRERLDL